MHFQTLTICGSVVYAPEAREKLVKVRIVCNDDSRSESLFITGCVYNSVADALLEVGAKPGDSITVHGSLRVVKRDDKTILWMDIDRFHVTRTTRTMKKRTKRQPVGTVDDGSSLL